MTTNPVTQNKMEIIKDLGSMLEDIVRGTDEEYSEIYINYLDKLTKITKMFMVNIKREIEIKKEKDDNSDNEELIKKYTNDIGDVDSVSEYEDNLSDTEIDSDEEEQEENNEDNTKKILAEFDNVIKQIYTDMKNNNVFIYRQV